jgi:dTDP-glucose 4,6-dehydratase
MNGGVRRYLITGGAGFIGSAVVRHLIGETPHEVAVVDKLTYAGHLSSLAPVAANPRYRFFREDVADGRRMRAVIAAFRPDVIMHLAAESHVDRSISAPDTFVRSNIVGTFTLLEAALAYWQEHARTERHRFRFHQVSTDEVFGSLGTTGIFNEQSPYRPNSPYGAAKASADHLVRAWHTTYGLPVVVSHCCNNYGPYQYPEKLVPLMILNALEGRPLPVYGDGSHVRDWLHVDDHVRALMLVAERGRVGETYAVGANAELPNLAVVQAICAAVDARRPDQSAGPSGRLIQMVGDRPGHDFRYAIDASKIRNELGWRPREEFSSGLAKTVDWYLANQSWWEPLRPAGDPQAATGGIT